MYGDEYLYQELGYRHIYSRLKDATEGEIVKRSVHISSLPVDSVTQEDIEEYNHFRKKNCGKQFILKDGLARTVLIVGYAILLLVAVIYLMDFIQKRNTTGLLAFGWIVIVFAGSLAWTLMREKKNSHPVKPYGVIRGYLVSTHMQSTTTRVGLKPYKKITVYSQCSVVWIEKKDMFLRNVNHSLVQFNYAGREYAWSELVYTPVKVFVFQDDSMELVPTFEKAK